SNPSLLSGPYSCFFSSSDKGDMSASRSFTCRSNDEAASRLPLAVSSTIRARRSLALDLRRFGVGDQGPDFAEIHIQLCPVIAVLPGDYEGVGYPEAQHTPFRQKRGGHYGVG